MVLSNLINPSDYFLKSNVIELQQCIAVAFSNVYNNVKIGNKVVHGVIGLTLLRRELCRPPQGQEVLGSRLIQLVWVLAMELECKHSWQFSPKPCSQFYLTCLLLSVISSECLHREALCSHRSLEVVKHLKYGTFSAAF